MMNLNSFRNVITGDYNALCRNLSKAFLYIQNAITLEMKLSSNTLHIQLVMTVKRSVVDLEEKNPYYLWPRRLFQLYLFIDNKLKEFGNDNKEVDGSNIVMKMNAHQHS